MIPAENDTVKAFNHAIFSLKLLWLGKKKV